MYWKCQIRLWTVGISLRKRNKNKIQYNVVHRLSVTACKGRLFYMASSMLWAVTLPWSVTLFSLPIQCAPYCFQYSFLTDAPSSGTSSYGCSISSLWTVALTTWTATLKLVILAYTKQETILLETKETASPINP